MWCLQNIIRSLKKEHFMRKSQFLFWRKIDPPSDRASNWNLTKTQQFLSKSKKEIKSLVYIVRNLIPFQNLWLLVKTGAFWAKMINSQNCHFLFLKFMMVAFFKLWTSKWSAQNCQYLGDQPQNLKNPCFSNLKVWISFKTSFQALDWTRWLMGRFRHT